LELKPHVTGRALNARMIPRWLLPEPEAPLREQAPRPAEPRPAAAVAGNTGPLRRRDPSGEPAVRQAGPAALHATP
jgi:hypothetical protein